MLRPWTTTLIGSSNARGNTRSTVPGRTPTFEKTGNPPIDEIVRAAVVVVGMTAGLMFVATIADGFEEPVYSSCPG